jgi:hypothetical protein
LLHDLHRQLEAGDGYARLSEGGPVCPAVSTLPPVKTQLRRCILVCRFHKYSSITRFRRTSLRSIRGGAATIPFCRE